MWVQALIYLVKSVFQQVILSSTAALGSVWWALQYNRHIIKHKAKEHFGDFQPASYNSTLIMKSPCIVCLSLLVEQT